MSSAKGPGDLRALAVPVLAVGAAAVMFLHGVPADGGPSPPASPGRSDEPARAAIIRRLGPSRAGA